MRIVVEDQLVVNLIRKDDQVITPRQLRDGFQHATGADRARGVIGIDEHNAPGARADLFMHIDQVGLPAVIFVQRVGIQLEAELGEHGRVQRIIRAGGQQVIAGVQERAQANVDGFAHA